MKIFRKIRLKLGQRSLLKRKALLRRGKRVHNFKTAASAGIVFDALYPEMFDQVKKLTGFLASENIKSTVIGYVNEDIVPGEFLFWGDSHFFGKKGLDFFFRPIDKEVSDFLNKKMDILFHLSFDDHFPLNYIASLTNADFKVGRFTEEPNELDFMINTGDNKNSAFLVEQLIHYVGMLNNEDN